MKRGGTLRQPQPIPQILQVPAQKNVHILCWSLRYERTSPGVWLLSLKFSPAEIHWLLPPRIAGRAHAPVLCPVWSHNLTVTISQHAATWLIYVDLLLEDGIPCMDITCSPSETRGPSIRKCDGNDGGWSFLDLDIKRDIRRSGPQNASAPNSGASCSSQVSLEVKASPSTAISPKNILSRVTLTIQKASIKVASQNQKLWYAAQRYENRNVYVPVSFRWLHIHTGRK